MTRTRPTNPKLRSRCARLRKGVALVFLGLLLTGTGAPVFAQADYDEKIEALEKSLEEIKASIAAGDDVNARIEALEDELANLKQQIADESSTSQDLGEEQASATGTDDSSAPSQSDAVADLPPPGVQGSPNPLQRDDHEYLTGEDLLDESFPNSLPIPGSNVRFKIGGYAKLDFIQDLDNMGDRFEFELATIPIEGTPEAEFGGRTTMHAKESRINFDFRSKARWKNGKEFPLQTFLEFDFFDDRESFSLQPRFRQAYGVIGRFLAGQTWTVTTDVTALAGTVDFSGGDALYGGRVAQIRFEDRLNESLKWAIGVEDPAQSIGNPLGLEGRDRPSLPTIAGKVRWEGQGGSHVQLGADVFQLEWQGGDGGASAKEMGFGAILSGRYLVGRKRRNALVGQATVGSGAAHRVISLSFDGGNDAVITPDGLDIMSHWQLYGGYSHYWTDSLNSTLALAWAELDNSEFQPGEAIHQAGSVHLNLVWFPYKLVSTGIEYMYGFRENKDGAEGTASRFQLMVKYKFN